MHKSFVLGPLNGHYIALWALPTGPLGEQHLGSYKVFDHQPADYLAPGHLQEGVCPQPCASVHRALDEATALARQAVAQLPPGPAPYVTEGTPLACLAYASSASHTLPAAELEHMIERARRRNAECGISGFLLLVDNRFMQYLEGPHPHLDLVYRCHILPSPLHQGVVELMREEITERQFATWSLAFDTPDDYRWTRRELNPMLQAPARQADVIAGMLGLFARQGAWPTADRPTAPRP